ncbi:hypothetical protein L2K70_04830 [Nocardioides KLBMP 9356]|uniref:Uncharacterized protein n=1 Tax=Nocardioides potassii TaxID=2911371 RepID=A0ABS9H6R3_9ACTN|nr:hypothetical protein [Nocardioides potassii]MCF6376920.1 hypothetical protein [Nocardioides potassii]
MTHVLAIDPGPVESAYALIGEGCRPVRAAKVPNAQLLDDLGHMPLGLDFDHAAIEMVASYGMAVGAEVFDTCVWIGRYAETIRRRTGTDPELVKRLQVKVHHCHDSRAKDSNIAQALVDRFAPGQPNRGKGTTAQPGFFHGFKADIWQAYALAVYVADTKQE